MEEVKPVESAPKRVKAKEVAEQPVALPAKEAQIENLNAEIEKRVSAPVITNKSDKQEVSLGNWSKLDSSDFPLYVYDIKGVGVLVRTHQNGDVTFVPGARLSLDKKTLISVV